MCMLKNFDCLKLVNFVEKLPEFQHFIQPQRKLLIAFSGGQDSTTLLTVFYILSKKWCFKLAVVYCYHGWSNKQKSISALFPIVMKYKLPLYIVERFGCNLDQSENEARKWRYAALEEVRKIAKYDIILTGHTLSDRVETVLFNLCRGSGLKGMGALKSHQMGCFPIGPIRNRHFLPFKLQQSYALCSNESPKWPRFRWTNKKQPLEQGQLQITTLVSKSQSSELLKKSTVCSDYLSNQTNKHFCVTDNLCLSCKESEDHYVFHYQSITMQEHPAFIASLNPKKSGILSFSIDFINQYLCYKYEQQIKWMTKASYTKQKTFHNFCFFKKAKIKSHLLKKPWGKSKYKTKGHKNCDPPNNVMKSCLTPMSVITFFHPTVYFSSYRYLKHLIFFNFGFCPLPYGRLFFVNTTLFGIAPGESGSRPPYGTNYKLLNTFLAKSKGRMLNIKYGSKNNINYYDTNYGYCYFPSTNIRQPANNVYGPFVTKFRKLLMKKITEKQPFLFFNDQLIKVKQNNCLFSKKCLFIKFNLVTIKLTQFCVSFSRSCYVKPRLNVISTSTKFYNNWNQWEHKCVNIISQTSNTNQDLNTLYVLRPLLPIRRLIITQFIQHLDLPISLDKSNQDLTISRNYMRKKIIPVLKLINPQCEQNIYKFSQIASFYFETHPQKNQMCPPSLLVYFM